MDKNGLERYNRRMKYDAFPSMHPDLVVFTNMLAEEGQRHEEEANSRESREEGKRWDMKIVFWTKSALCTSFVQMQSTDVVRN